MSEPSPMTMTVAELKQRMSETAEKMTVDELNRVISRHHGAKRRLAEQLGLTATTITNILKNSLVSARVVAAARLMVAELLCTEAKWGEETKERAAQ